MRLSLSLLTLWSSSSFLVAGSSSSRVTSHNSGSSMPSCAVSTVSLSSPPPASLHKTFKQDGGSDIDVDGDDVAVDGAVAVAVSEQVTSSVTLCGNLCEVDDRCGSFTMELLRDQPTCTLFQGVHGASNAVLKLQDNNNNDKGPQKQDGKPYLLTVGSCGANNNGDHDNNNNNAKKAGGDLPLLLGLDYFEKGIDAINDTINRSQHIRLPVYNYHFQEGKSWFNPFTQVAYEIPDEVSQTVNEAGYEEIDSLYTHVYTASVSETTKRYSYSIGVQMDFGQIGAGVTYSDNKQWYDFNLEEHEQDNYNSHSVMWWKFWEIQAYPFDVLGTNSVDPLFKAYLDQLPKTISGPNDTAKYNTLLSNWGTHYCTWANFGGQLNLDIFVNGSFDRSQSQQWNSDQHSLSFHFHLYDIDPSASIAGFTNKSQIHVNESFKNESRVRLFYEGGDPTLMGEESLAPWRTSIQKQPHWLNVTYEPLSKLPFLDSQVAATLDSYIIKYIKDQLKG